MRKIVQFILLLICIVQAGCTSQKQVVIENSGNNKQSAQITAIANATIFSDSNFNSAHIGISIYNPEAKEYLYNYQGDKYFVPASNMKLFTCYAAMKNLGDSLLGFSYAISKDTLYIKGNADASLLHDDYRSDAFLNIINDKKINAIVIDDRNWKDNGFGKGWAWDDYSSDYMAERSPLPMYGNLLTFNFNKDEIDVKPEIGFTTINFNTYKTFSIKRLFNDNKYSFIPADKTPQTIQIPFITNGVVTAQKILFSLTNKLAYSVTQLVSNGIKINESITYKAIHSQPTDSILKPMMHRSDNFFAEQTLLMISNEKLGLMNDAKIIDTLLKTDFKGLPQPPKWVDGSGLSRYNLITPQDFVWVLTKMKNDFSWQRITTILPTGNAGTLSNYYKNLSGKMFAKTGTLSNQVALSGYLITKENKTLVFSILVNNHLASATAIRRGVEKFLNNVWEKY